MHSVEEELCKPLLVGPGTPEPEHRQLVVFRQAVLPHLAARDEREPAVGDEQLRWKHRKEDDSERRQDDDEDELLLGDTPQSPHVPGRPRLPSGGAGLRRRLTPLAAGCVALGARPYSMYCPSRLALASLASGAPGT